MALFRKFYEPCVQMEPAQKPDGHGGQRTYWDETRGFEAAVVRNSSAVVVIAQADAMERTYTVTTPTGTGLRFGDVFKRRSDGQTFRVTSSPKDQHTPEVSTFQFEQVTAEAWELPDE